MRKKIKEVEGPDDSYFLKKAKYWSNTIIQSEFGDQDRRVRYQWPPCVEGHQHRQVFDVLRQASEILNLW